MDLEPGPMMRWLARRLDPSRPTGLWLSVGAALAGFLSIAEDLPLAGDTLVVTVHTAAAALVLAALGRWRRAVVLIATVATAAGVSEVLKGVFDRPRPPAAAALIALPSNASFPSGHAIATLALYGGIALMVILDATGVRARVAAGGTVALAAIAVGVSRVYLGVHWPSDVVASWLLGTVVLCAAGWVAVAWVRSGALADAGGGLSAGWRLAVTAVAVLSGVVVLVVETWRYPLV